MSEKIRDADKLLIRVPTGMRERIRAAAEYNGVSMNTLLVMVLENAFPRRTEITEDDVDKSLSELRRRMVGAKPAEQAALYQKIQDLIVDKYFEPLEEEE